MVNTELNGVLQVTRYRLQGFIFETQKQSHSPWDQRQVNGKRQAAVKAL